MDDYVLQTISLNTLIDYFGKNAEYTITHHHLFIAVAIVALIVITYGAYDAKLFWFQKEGYENKADREKRRREEEKKRW